MNRNENRIIRWLKSNYKGLVIVFVMVAASILINAYIGFGPTSPSLPITNNKIQLNTKANPFVMHGSFNLYITINNKPLTIPSQIGIEQSLWHNHTLDKYGTSGMSMQGTIMTGMAPLYTNDNSGNIKIGSTIVRNYTLADFFNIWGFDLNGKTVNATINGKPVSNFKEHILQDNEKIYLTMLESK